VTFIVFAITLFFCKQQFAISCHFALFLESREESRKNRSIKDLAFYY